MMKYFIRGDKLAVTDAIRDYAISKIDRMEKYFDKPEDVSVKVIFSVRGREQKVEITINSINRFNNETDVVRRMILSVCRE